MAKTNSMALGAIITSSAGTVVCGLGIFIFFIGGFLGIPGTVAGAILGHVARSQIRRTGERGAGLALAGIIVGWTITGLYLSFIVAFMVAFLFALATGSGT